LQPPVMSAQSREVPAHDRKVAAASIPAKQPGQAVQM
jgi:hypothetical protein